MKQYLDLLRNIRDNGDHKPDAREGLPGTKSLFGPQMEFDLSQGFPIITTKAVSFHNIAVELCWFLRGKQNIKYLVDSGVNIWNEDAYNYFVKLFPDNDLPFENFVELLKMGKPITGDNDSLYPFYTIGDTGNQYPTTWRKFGQNDYSKGIDQISRVLTNLRKNPNGRRHLVSSIDVFNDDDLALYWCHALFQFNCREIKAHDRKRLYEKNYGQDDALDSDNWDILDQADIPSYYLDCKLYQRSADTVLGVPYNISSYALLTEIFAKILNYIPGRFIHSFGDVHIYDNHEEAVNTQLLRDPLPLPFLEFSDEFYELITQYTIGDVWYIHEIWSQLKPEMFRLRNYRHHAPIKATLNTGMKKIEFENGSTIEFKGTNSMEAGKASSPLKDLIDNLSKVGAASTTGRVNYDTDGNPTNTDDNDGQ